VGRNSKQIGRSFDHWTGLTVSPAKFTPILFRENMGSLHPRDVQWVNNSRHDQILELITQKMVGHISPKH